MPIHDIAPKPTVYRDRHFRSRLEASWAAWFDVMEWTWIYEPDAGVGDYQPDFLVVMPPYGVRTYVETKPESFADSHEIHDRHTARWREFVRQGAEPLLVLIGRPGQWSEGRLDPVDVVRLALYYEPASGEFGAVRDHAVRLTGCDTCGETGIAYYGGHVECRCLRRRRAAMPAAMAKACQIVRNIDWNDRWRQRSETGQ